ncbi:peptidyl-prolyl cis-cyclophilin type [Micractinium conductrix]|uniref:Peptidyl-prolyl cis-cyclophilin type n=1 Tax=Micractinium conductrix TaxID=554055 RepID=A0A2P6V9U8_9CHLO|nr:peptidyl-prolyl cis-cyclophilin type [Micractinium conductrix]|eukprot:PSC70864.1 peptidyl-prolyl cis-cyclophilin type [Micractinium conductrix]
MRRPHAAALLLALAAAMACLAAAVDSSDREGVFVGYKEVGVDGVDGDDGAAANGGAADGADAGGDAAADVQNDGAGAGNDADADTLAAEAAVAAASELQAAAAELGRTVVLFTQFGPIKVKLLEKLAPRATSLVWDLAEHRGCNDCAFYRNEARPASGDGPPYALLQGRMPELAQVVLGLAAGGCLFMLMPGGGGGPPREGNIEVKMGHACFIPETKDFFIAYKDHPEWETSHTVWGLVDEWFATDLMISQQYKKVHNPEYGTEMRMLKVEVPYKLAVEGDTTWDGLLGPLH